MLDVFEVLREFVPDVVTELGERAKVMSSPVKALKLSTRVSDEEWREREGL